eukprot:2534532-Pyramimonas_sp.AAC.1
MLLATFGLWGPSPGPGTVNERLRTENGSQGTGRGLQGPVQARRRSRWAQRGSTCGRLVSCRRGGDPATG